MSDPRKPDLSVIIPFCNEWPMVAFTIRNIAEELQGCANFEIIAIDNYCDEVAKQNREPDRSHEHIKAVAKGHPWLKVVKYDEKLSHWQAKNLGVRNAKADILWFCDAHCMIARDGLVNMLSYYQEHHEQLNGTLHLPLTYHIMEWHRLIYKLVAEPEKGNIHYSFTRFRPDEHPYRVPCMSTCGMMMTRAIYDELGGWPKELGIYGGGENFINFTLAVLGKTVNIFPDGTLYHHGDKRGYHWNGDDYVRNRTIANYIFGGEELAARFIDRRKGDKKTLQNILQGALEKEAPHRKRIKERQKMSIKEWLSHCNLGGKYREIES